MTIKLSLGEMMPQYRAIARAVTRLSPVTIRTATPASLHMRTASGTSSRTGSYKPHLIEPRQLTDASINVTADTLKQPHSSNMAI
jgi:hypothetical protein